MSDLPSLTFVPAATVVIFRNGTDRSAVPELLMVQRSKQLRFAGGAVVFPGGRIDPADRELAAAILPDADPDMAAARIAAIRETLEETGLVIATEASVSEREARDARALLTAGGTLGAVIDRFGWTFTPDRLIPFAHWCPQWDGAFDTRFFLYDLGTGAVDLTIDATENTRLFWATAADVLAMADRGECQVIFPTRRNLERLARYGSFADARADAEITPIRAIAPVGIERDGEVHLTIPEGLGYPVTSQLMSTVRRG